MVRHHMRPHLMTADGQISARAVRKFRKDAEDNADSIFLIAAADHIAGHGRSEDDKPLRRYAEAIAALRSVSADQSKRAESALIDGRDIIALGADQGPLIGRIKRALEDAQATGEISTRDQAISMARRMIDSEQETHHPSAENIAIEST